MIAVIGCGAWATTVAKMCAENGYLVKIWVHRSEYVSLFNTTRENTIALPGVSLPAMTASEDLSTVLSGVSAVFYCVPTKFTDTLSHFLSHKIEAPILCLSKGVVGPPSWTLCRHIEEALNRVSDKSPHVGVLSGPNLAMEVAHQKPCAAVVGCTDEATAKMFAKLLTRPYFRVYFSTDRVGVAWGGILKNYLAITAGLADGLSLGTNAKAALLTRGLVEMTRIALAFGAQRETIYGLSGVGDLIATCVSTASRNYQVGFSLAENKAAEPTVSHAVAEGIKTVDFLKLWNDTAKLDLPILTELYAVLYAGKPVRKAMQSLLEREIREE
jgi:glycerol-3-phosphate dehydrogenase (NAD(P)+)